MNNTNIQVKVNGPQALSDALRNYGTIILKPNVQDNRNVLTQDMMSKRNTKYVIQWNYDLLGETITVPEGCMIEFNGGTITNGTIVGNNTILLYDKNIDEICTANREGTFIYNTTVADEEDITSETGQLKFKDKVYNPEAYSGLAKKILRKNMVNGVNTLTQDMINEANTIYIIRYDYTLKEDITIPANCVLQFDGGSIKNGNITLNNTFVSAVNMPIFDNIIFSGSISNDFFNALWVKGNDIGESINIAGIYFNKIKVPKNDYIFTTPITIAGARYVEMLGTYSYQGEVYNNLSLITFRNSSAAIIRVGDVTCYDIMANMDYRDDRTKNVIGVRFLNVVFSNLFVQRVAYLNEGIRICSDRTAGGGDNFLEGNRLSDNNIGVRIYQENTQSGGISFVNDTRIKINYCNCHSDFPSTSTSYGVYLAGPNADPVSYKTDATDTYDKCNGIVIDGGDYEGLKTVVYARNATFSIKECREEAITNLVKAVGRVSFSYKEKYENALRKLDLSECIKFSMFDYQPPCKNEFDIKVLRFKNGNYNYVYPYNYHCLKPSRIDNTPDVGSNMSMIGAIIENIIGKFLLVRLDKPERIAVGYLDAENNNVSGDYPAPYEDFNYMRTDNYWRNGNDVRQLFFMIPAGVSRIIVGSTITDNKFSIYSLGVTIDNNQVVRSGDTRPAALPSDEPFFDTTLGKPIFAKASASGSVVTWVDATGTPV